MARFFRLFFRFLLKMIWISAFCLCLTLFFFGGFYFYYRNDFPDLRHLKNYTPPLTTRLYATHGQLLTEYAFQKRLFFPLSEIPPSVKNAFLAAEDKSFYHHFGFDPIGIVRALLFNVLHPGKRPRGASTITQQVARNLVLKSQSLHLVRKIKELVLAISLEFLFSKEHLLELYLNEIYLGRGAYGVGTASLFYFNKNLQDLSLEEASFLAALPKAPAHYDPLLNPERAKQRRDWVLKRMFLCQMISTEQMEKALRQPLVTHETYQETYVPGGSFFSEEVRRFLQKTYGEKKLYTGGLTVQTTLDPTYQKEAEHAFFRGLEAWDRKQGWRGPLHRFNAKELKHWGFSLEKTNMPPEAPTHWKKGVVLQAQKEGWLLGFSKGERGLLPYSQIWIETHSEENQIHVGDVLLVSCIDHDGKQYTLEQTPLVNGAMIAMDPKTGRILAMVGGYSFRSSQFNRATQAMRSPGSLVKPLWLLAAFEKGLSPGFLLKDEPIEIAWNNQIYAPENFSKQFLGWMTLRRAIELSQNIPMFRLMMEQIELSQTASLLKRFHLVPTKTQATPSLILGSFETTLWKMVKLYASFANRGQAVEPTCIDFIQDRYGSVVYRHKPGNQAAWNAFEKKLCEPWKENLTPPPYPESSALMDSRHAYIISHVLQGVSTRGTARRFQNLPQPLASKTGTSSQCRDAWIMAYTPDLVVGLYIGYDDFRSMGDKEGGAKVAVPILEAFLKRILPSRPNRPFPVPSNLRWIPESADPRDTFADCKETLEPSPN